MRKFNYLIGLSISFIFVYFFVKNFHFQETLKALREVNYWYIIPLIVANIATLFIRSVRWQYLLSPIKCIPILNLFPAAVIGFMANIIFPARIGEFVRAYVIGKKEDISKSASFATIVVERLFDGLMITLLFLLILLFFPFVRTGNHEFTSTGIKLGGTIFVAFCCSIFLLLVLIKSKILTIDRILIKTRSSNPPPIIHKISKLINSFSEGLAVLNNYQEILFVVLYSLVLWTVYVLGIYFLFSAFDLKLPFIAAIFIQGLLALGISLPSAPGYIGTFHLACSLGLIYLGVPPSYAQSYSIILWFINIFPATMLGLLFLWKEGLTLKKINVESSVDSSDQPS